MPLIRRMPKRGFSNVRFATVHLPVNILVLNRFEDGTRVDESLLRLAGLANGPADGIKILGSGKLERKLTVCAQAFSAAARAQIEALGGTCELVASANAG